MPPKLVCVSCTKECTKRGLLLVRKRVLRSRLVVSHLHSVLYSGWVYCTVGGCIVQWVGVLYSVYSHIITSKAEPHNTLNIKQRLH